MSCKPKLLNSKVSEFMPYNVGDMIGRPALKTAPLFGKRLAAIRKSKGLSQLELAKKLGTSRANVTYYERKAVNPTLDLIRKCAEILEIPLSDLIEPEASSKKKPGPKSRLEEQLEAVSKLPKSKQRFVSQFLDTVLQAS